MLSRKAQEIGENWGSARIFVDLWHLDSGIRSADGTHPIVTLGHKMHSLGLSFVPVTGFRRHREYQSAIAMVVKRDKKGVCVRLNPEDIKRINLSGELEGLLGQLGLSPDDVDLLVDYQSLSGSPPNIAASASPSPIRYAISAPYVPNTIANVISPFPHLPRYFSA